MESTQCSQLPNKYLTLDSRINRFIARHVSVTVDKMENTVYHNPISGGFKE